MKKLILTLLISSFGLAAYAKPNYSYTIVTPSTQTSTQTQLPNNTQGAYINEEITTPITQIGGLENLSVEEPVEEDQSLEIVWNQWHADVRNAVLKKARLSEKNIAAKIYYKVDNLQNIYDIVVIYIKESDLSRINGSIYMLPNQPFYAYSSSKNKYYAITFSNYVEYIGDNVTKALPRANCNEISKYMIPYSTAMKNYADSVKNLSKNTVLIFPKRSKRTLVQVYQGVVNIDWLRGGYCNADDYNDIETIKER